VLGRLTKEEGVLTCRAVMDPARQHYDPQSSYGGWLQPGPWAGCHVVNPLDIAGGRLGYAISRQRRRMARAAAKGTNAPAAMAV
jgi:hypothetical protein